MSDTRMPMPILTAMHPGNPHGLRFLEGDGGETGGSQAPADDEGKAREQDSQAFTQADVDKMMAKVRAEERRKATEKFADYDDLKAKAGTAQTAEERLAELEKRYKASETRALRSDIAARFSIAAEDRDLFLTGTDEETLTAQAQRLVERESDRKHNGNHAPLEGTNPPPADDKDATARAFFGI